MLYWAQRVLPTHSPLKRLRVRTEGCVHVWRDTPTTTSVRERMQHEPLHRGQEGCILLKQDSTFLAHGIGERGREDLRDQGDQRRRGTVPSVRAHRTECRRHTNTSFCLLDCGEKSSIVALSFRGLRWCHTRSPLQGRTLSFDDIKHYQRIVAALAETIILMEHIDATIDEHGGWTIN